MLIKHDQISEPIFGFSNAEFFCALYELGQNNGHLLEILPITWRQHGDIFHKLSLPIASIVSLEDCILYLPASLSSLSSSSLVLPVK